MTFQGFRPLSRYIGLYQVQANRNMIHELVSVPSRGN